MEKPWKIRERLIKMHKHSQNVAWGTDRRVEPRALFPLVLVFVGTWQMATGASAATSVPSIFTDAGRLVGSDLTGLTIPGETVVSGNSTFQSVNPGAVNLAYSADLRAYFVGDQENRRSSFGYSVDGADPMMLFPYASGKRAPPPSGHSPLYPGDFAEMGPHDAGSQLDFFLIARGGEMGGRTEEFWANPAGNNGDVRAVAFAQADSPYLFVSFEDSFSGGRDYSDMMAAVFMGEQNVNALLGSGGVSPDGGGVPAPEPAFVWLIVAGCGLWLHRVRRRKTCSR
jgi:hypothetical protein